MDKSFSGSNTMSSDQATQSALPSQSSQQSAHPSDDVGWLWGYCPDWSRDKLSTICKLCGHKSKGGVYRLKQHVAGIKGNVKTCPKATPADRQKAKESLDGAKEKKTVRISADVERRSEVQVSRQRLEEEEDIQAIGQKRPREFGGIHRYATFLPQDPRECEGSGSGSKLKQTHIDEAERKRRRDATHHWVSLWAYEAGVPFHTLTIPNFGNMSEAIGQYGPRYVGPTMYQLREPLLKKALEKTSVGLEEHKRFWNVNGCSLMTDSWTDRKRRCVMNMCVHCSAGVSFYNSLEDSAVAHTGEFIFQWVDKCIEEIGSKNVIQVVTDNHSANMNAKELLKSKRPEMFWTSCAAHTIDLMLEDIGKLTKFKNTIEKAKGLTVFIYSHHKTLALMRQCTKNKDIVRPGITRFATPFLTLSSLLEKKDQLIAMFGSPEYSSMKFVGDTKRKSEVANATVISKTFWNNVKFCLKVFTPLFRLLRLVDSDRYGSMGFIVGELLLVKREIKASYKNIEEYKPIMDIIDKKDKNRLESPLHLAAWYLNPLYFYADNGEAKRSVQALDALMECCEVFCLEPSLADVAYNQERFKYQNSEGIFGRPMAIRQVKYIEESRNPDNYEFTFINYNLAQWWESFGGDVPNLRLIAIKILNLTGSSSGCERNWSTFEGIHTKKRNRLDSKRLRDLVYVQFNMRIKTKLSSKRKDDKDRDILLARDARNATSWVVEDYNSEDEDNDDLYPGTDIPLRVVSQAAGADEILQPSSRYYTRRGQVSTSAGPSREVTQALLEEPLDFEEEETNSEEDNIQLEDSNSDDDILKDEILMLGADSDDN